MVCDWTEGFPMVVMECELVDRAKTIPDPRRQCRNSTGLGALHVVSAWAGQAGLTLGQVAVDAKSNEITAMPQLLELLDLRRKVVTADAMGCQKEIAETIVGQGGDYVLAVKDNQP